ncbi:unnamed protein product [marine sediment metagenome]|uniref:Uncharacterized protein n=1 Tax=marine sediment metagenome TaxID=412755 RepID=X0W6Z8_9ZZZZ
MIKKPEVEKKRCYHEYIETKKGWRCKYCGRKTTPSLRILKYLKKVNKPDVIINRR